jgi:hypothetical protein
LLDKDDEGVVVVDVVGVSRREIRNKYITGFSVAT